jgi:hypothetical protein
VIPRSPVGVVAPVGRIFLDSWWLEGSGKAQQKFWGDAPADFLYGENIHGFVCKLTNPIVNRVPPGVKPPFWGLLWKSSSRIGRWIYKRGINPRRPGDWGTLSPGLDPLGDHCPQRLGGVGSG